MGELGKTIIIFGIILVIVGIGMVFSGRIPFLGKLPGDIFVQRGNFTFYFPIMTSIIISIVLTIIINFFIKK